MRKHIVVYFTLILLLLSAGCSTPNTPEHTPTPLSPTKIPVTETPTSLPTLTLTPQPTLSALYPGAGEYIDAIVSSDFERRFKVHVPEGYDPGTPTPLVLNFHGAGASVSQQELLSYMSVVADEAGFIVVYPQAEGYPTYWDTSTSKSIDVIFVSDLLDHLETHLNIDPKRIYATGFSNGGTISDWLACVMADRIAAVGPVAGAYWYDSPCKPTRPVPVVAFHGTNDGRVPYWGGMGLYSSIPFWAEKWAERNGCNPEPVKGFEQSGVIAQFWGKCEEHADVVLYTAQQGTHTWPGSMYGLAPEYLDASRAIWRFFESHPMP
jgi:polyhydroxybutyrate depolymerase